MLGQRQWSPRTAYIVRQGILRHGIVIGALITALGILPEIADFAAPWRVARVGAVVIVAWALWAVVTGWIVGAFLWSFHERRQRRADPPR